LDKAAAALLERCHYRVLLSFYSLEIEKPDSQKYEYKKKKESDKSKTSVVQENTSIRESVPIIAQIIQIACMKWYNKVPEA